MGNSLYFDAILLSLLAGSAIALGGGLASVKHLCPTWLEDELHHTITAVGAGALLAAIALVLVPEGIKHQSEISALATFLMGGCGAMALDYYFAKRKTTASQLVAMVLDFIPETIIIGAVITKNYQEAILLAVIIFAQNLPESFNAYREMKRSNKTGRFKLIFWFFAIAATGPIYMFLGAMLLSSHEGWLAMMMTFCAGGILYLVFNDIAPQVKLKNRFSPPMGALLGFVIGMIGYQLTQ